MLLNRADFLSKLKISISLAFMHDTRYFANGVFFSDDTLVASDAYRLFLSKPISGACFSGIIVSKESLSKVMKFLAANTNKMINVVTTNDSCSIDGIDCMVIPGGYPPYLAAMPKKIRYSRTLAVKPFLASLAQLRAVAPPNRCGIFSARQCIVLDPGTWEASAPCEWQDGGYDSDLPFAELMYNLDHLKTVLSTIKGNATFEWGDKDRPVRIHEKGGNGVFLLVPTRF